MQFFIRGILISDKIHPIIQHWRKFMKSKKPGLLYVLFSFSTACAMLYLLGAHALRKSLLYFRVIY